MDLFGTKEHDARHAAAEAQIRDLLEQVAQLTIELGQTRADIRHMQAQLEGKMDTPDADAFDEDLADARAKHGAAKSASEEAWREIYPQLATSLGKVRDAIDGASKDEPTPNSD